MLDFDMDLPAWLRTTAALLVMGVGILLVVVGYIDRPKYTETPLPDGRVLVVEEGGGRGPARAFRAGFVVCGVGAVLLMMSGKSRSEKGGYNF
jgi:uncharacterized membrane protein YidH (DUF202 family)